MKFHEDMDKEKFFLQWFGLIGGRELGWNTYPHRNWTDNPDDLLDFVKACESSHEDGEYCRPCWITAQPMRFVLQKGERKIGKAMAIEKLYFDFDDDTKYCEKCDKYIKKDNLEKGKNKEKGSFCPHCKSSCEEQPRLDVVGEEVKEFLKNSIIICKSQSNKFSPEPLIVRTRKGYHVYFFLVDVLVFSKGKFKFAKALYKDMQKILAEKGEGEYEFLDKRVIGDLNRFARVPLTPHEKTGKICEIVDQNLKPTKVRNTAFFKTYGIPESFVKATIKKLKKRLREEHLKREEELKKFENEAVSQNGRTFRNEIRPCFTTRMARGEMKHGQRLAWLAEIYHNGYDTPEKMLELCRKTWNDFLETKSMQQIKDYFEHKRYDYPPYRCKTIRREGWCLYDKCPLWKPEKI